MILDQTMKITKQQFESLYSEEITKKEYDRIIDLINDRIDDIFDVINGRRKNGCWYVYGNYDYHSEDDCGYFDLDRYKENIELSGEDFSGPEPFCDGGRIYIPTNWLWEDFEDEFNAEVAKAKKEKEKEKAKAKEQREARKVRLKELTQSIKSKLTKEELKVIKFKK